MKTRVPFVRHGAYLLEVERYEQHNTEPTETFQVVVPAKSEDDAINLMTWTSGRGEDRESMVVISSTPLVINGNPVTAVIPARVGLTWRDFSQMNANEYREAYEGRFTEYNEEQLA